MNKLFTCICMIIASAMSAMASTESGNEYFLDEVAMEQTISSASDVSMATFASPLDVNSSQGKAMINSNDKILFLVLNFFFGSIAVHRYYMGVDGAWYMFAGYCCVPIAGGVAACGDFFYVLFGTSKSLNEYQDNKRWFVWAG